MAKPKIAVKPRYPTGIPQRNARKAAKAEMLRQMYSYGPKAAASDDLVDAMGAAFFNNESEGDSV
jgi:hypothetical protein